MSRLFSLLKRRLPLLFSFLFISILAQAQLKIGDNPTSIQKSSILELESTQAGFAITQINRYGCNQCTDSS